MGLGDFIPDEIEDAVEEGTEVVGKGVENVGNKAADGMDAVGMDDMADYTRRTSREAADDLGADVAEMRLGETNNPKKLIYGSTDKLATTVSHLRDFQAAFERIGNGLKGLQSSGWQGEAAGAFRLKMTPEPKKWFTAADAFEMAAEAMDRFSDTVAWAQGQAREALVAYRQAEQDSKDAVVAYNAKVRAYNSDILAFGLSGVGADGSDTVPQPPGDFTDPGHAGREAAQEQLSEARKQRDRAAEMARTAVRTAHAAAPEKPGYGDQVRSGMNGVNLAVNHTVSGVIRGGSNVIAFGRSLNPMDPYNQAHPDEFATGLNNTAKGLLETAKDPLGAADRAMQSFKKDPYEGVGRLFAEVAGPKGAGLAKTGTSGARRGAGAARHGRHRSPARRDMDRDGPGGHRQDDNQRTTGNTDPVDLATGKMFLPQTDVSLPGALPLVFTRRVESGYTAGRWFGPSWSSTADQRLEIDAEGVVLVSEDGLLLAYPHPAPGVPTLPQAGPRWPLERTPEGDYTVMDPERGHLRHYTGPASGDADGTALLDRITDRNGNTLTFAYDTDGVPTDIAHSAGYHLRITTENDRITALHLVGGAEDGGDALLLRYGYTQGDLTEVTNSSGLPLRFDYDDEHRVIAWTDTNDRRYDYVYDNQHRCIAEGGEAGHIAIRIDYDGRDEATGHRVTTVTTRSGHRTRYLVNDALQVVAETDPLGHTVRHELDRHDRPLSHTDALDRTTRFRYDTAGHLAAVVRLDGRTVTIDHNELGLPVAITGADGTTWTYAYDARGNRTAATDPAGHTTHFTYDELGHLTSVTDALGATTRVRCDAAGLPIEITDPLGATTRYTRDRFGRPVTITDPLGAPTHLTWTVEGHLTHRVDPNGAAENWTYDGEGNRVSHTDAGGGNTTYEYTHFDLLAATTGPDGVRHTFEHDDHLRLTQVTNPQGLTWSYVYDPAGRLTSETDFDGRNTRYEHDPTGALTARINPLGQTIRLERDALGRVVRKDAGEGRVTTYEHDAAGRLLAAIGPDAQVRYQRDRLGRVKTEMAGDHVLSHTYDALGRRTRRITPSGARSTFAYDAAGNRTQLTASGRAMDFAYDPAGRELARHTGALTLSHLWDPAGRLTDQLLTPTPGGIPGTATAEAGPGPTGGTTRHRRYTYRPDGHLTSVTDSTTGTQHFDLTATGRVTAVRAADWSETYAYDAAGNQTRAQWPDDHATPEARGDRAYTGTRITRAGRIRYEHDAAGRLILRQHTRLSRKPDTWRYEWDAEDRLTAVTTPDGTRWRYTYDPLGRRIAKERLAPDGETAVERVNFTYDGGTLIEQTTTAPDLPNPVTLTWDHDGLTPISQTERITDATTQHEIDARFFAIVTDLVGAPTELIAESGETAWQSRTTLWGTTTWPRTSPAYTPLRFPGQYFDPETALHYNIYRYYDPGAGRYLSPDPLGLEAAPNPVAYVDNPVTWCDPLGLGPDGCPKGEIGNPFKGRNAAERAAFDSAGVPYGTKPDAEWTVMGDKHLKHMPGHVYSPEPTHWGNFRQYETEHGSRVIVEHTDDPAGLHFHAGGPKGLTAEERQRNLVNFGWDSSREGYATMERYRAIPKPGGDHHFFYETAKG
ncbi:putative T7SS-secreted protein [Streptomyces zagrosensis]|uniref:RHS repeat-associated protein n=1 Tax=Streptomyces zagrosensis TaxID=1042984 RepID=A0A7W9QDP7_9ACTN|nr:RHS repeat-associated core domain-containing protein [Streptomyces zagrosensis]MBB5938064.1 RHS repeat-associated protein [Streptomyces zagrosensis]